MTKEARIIAVEGYPEAQKNLELRLLHRFGGFTKVASEGAWIDPATGKIYREPGWIYDVAIEDDAEAWASLRDAAEIYCYEAEQLCVYLRLPNGQVEFVEQKPADLEVAA